MEGGQVRLGNSAWILSRLSPDENSEVEVNSLYDAIIFEAIECGEMPSKKLGVRLFVEHLMKLYPHIKRVRKNGRTLYRGISLLPFQEVVPESKISNIGEVYDSLPSDMQKTIKNNSVVCSLNSESSSNGQTIVKIVKFHLDGTWSLVIASKEIELSKMHISNKYQLNNVQLILNIIEKIDLCCGVKITKSVMISRFHTVELFKISEDTEGIRSVRSLNCDRTVPFNHVSSCCRTCQQMTFTNNTFSDKENIPSNNETNASEKNTTTVTADDIRKIIPEGNDEMVDLFKEQANNVKKDPRGRRWSKKFISICLQLFNKSPQGYELLRQSKILLLPSASLLILYKNQLRQDIGYHEDIFMWMFNEAKRRNVINWSGGIIFDEMSIQSDLQITKNGDAVELTGFTELGQDGNMLYTMRKGKKDKVLGTDILQMLFLGITGFRFPFAHFVTDSIQTAELYFLFWEAVDKLKMYGFNVLYTCMDGAKCNRSFLKINISDRIHTFTTLSPCNLNNIVFMMDVSHVLKKIRNNVLKSGTSDKCTRLITLPTNDTVQWQMFVDCYYWDCSNCLQLHRKLSKDHIFPDNQLKMRNYLAEDVLNSEMVHVMKQYQVYLGEKGKALTRVIDFLEQTSVIVRIFRDMRPIKNADDERLQELERVDSWFQKWEDSVTKEKRERV